MRGRGRGGWREGAERGRGETEPSAPVTWIDYYYTFFFDIFFWLPSLQCVGHSLAYVAHFVFLRDKIIMHVMLEYNYKDISISLYKIK